MMTLQQQQKQRQQQLEQQHPQQQQQLVFQFKCWQRSQQVAANYFHESAFKFADFPLSSPFRCSKAAVAPAVVGIVVCHTRHEHKWKRRQAMNEAAATVRQSGRKTRQPGRQAGG